MIYQNMNKLIFSFGIIAAVNINTNKMAGRKKSSAKIRAPTKSKSSHKPKKVKQPNPHIKTSSMRNPKQDISQTAAHVKTERLRGGNLGAFIEGAKAIASVKPFQTLKNLSKKIGLYDKLEKGKVGRVFNRIADAGESVGLGQKGAGGPVIRV